MNNRNKKQNKDQEADFFRVSAWRERGELCAKWLKKGKKVCVIGPVSVSTYQTADGTTRAQMDVTAEDVEFLSSPEKNDKPDESGYTQVDVENPY